MRACIYLGPCRPEIAFYQTVMTYFKTYNAELLSSAGISSESFTIFPKRMVKYSSKHYLAHYLAKHY